MLTPPSQACDTQGSRLSPHRMAVGTRATWIAAVVAIIAASLAIWQALEARASRQAARASAEAAAREQAKAEAFARASAVSWRVDWHPRAIGLYLRNVGTAPAHDVTVGVSTEQGFTDIPSGVTVLNGEALSIGYRPRFDSSPTPASLPVSWRGLDGPVAVPLPFPPKPLPRSRSPLAPRR
jgi:hypothetical protein